MKQIGLIVLCLLVLLISSFSGKKNETVNEFTFPEPVSVENQLVRVTFYPHSGKFDFFDKVKNLLVFKDAVFKIDSFSSSDPGVSFTCSSNNNGRQLQVAATYTNGLRFNVTIDLRDNAGNVTITPAVTNNSQKPVVIKSIYAVANASILPDQELSKVQLLDGNGGGEITHVRNEPYCNSRNNLLFTGLAGKHRVTFTIGGLSYEYFEKYATVNSTVSRKEHLEAEMKQSRQSMQAYLNLGTEKRESDNAIKLKLEQGKPFTLQTTSITEINQVAYDEKEVIISAAGLNSSKSYTLGFSWIDEFDKRAENVLVADATNPDKRFSLLLNQPLPTALEQDSAEQLLFNIPKEAYRSGKMKIFFQKANQSVNSVVSEVWINEGEVNAEGTVSKVRSGPVKQLVANLFASDPTGKLLQPGESFTSENDKYYIDLTTEDPFVSLEKYALALKKEQKIYIRPYTFPTVCLWYASHGGYGGETVAVNDSKGAVDEMTKIARSGFLNYSTASVRLVPDSYLPNNEQGWWDDAHWQKYGSGSGAEHVAYNVKVEGGHYKTPFETTEKWAGAVSRLGGIPLTYFQTGVRSQDYAEAFPGHMLFNEPNREARNYWPNPNKVTYDFTDPDFIKHMQQVYAHLRRSGIQGLMFDYPITGWADYGGFEDDTKTTAWAYRNIFKLAHDGLNGDSSLIHERNLARGSEITLGTVASQRVWGDTDGMTPEMMTRCGLRWYKDRVVVSYDTDSKNLAKFRKVSRDKLQQVLTMVYVTTGRLLIGNSFSLLSNEDVYDLSRVFPFHETPQSARPIDAFVNLYPSVYDFKVNDSWHLVTLYNTNEEGEKKFGVPLGIPNIEGGLSLDPAKQYYVYDFWNQHFIGKLSGNDTLHQTVRKDEARMIAVHEVKNHPQFISTNRHIMQGYLDLESVQWTESTQRYSGEAKLIRNEPFKIIIAGNGHLPKRALSQNKNVRIKIRPAPSPGIYELELLSSKTEKASWCIQFGKK